MIFMASNGIIVESETQAITGYRHIKFATEHLSETFELSAAFMKALIEALDHERDEELGRWRWPENPDYVVYPKLELQARDNTRGVTVLTERVPRTYTVWEDNVAILYGTSSDEVARKGAREAARAYFEAHPESKPWHDAKAGEVWVLTIDGEDVPLRTIYDGRNVRFFPLDDNSDAITYGVRSSGITDGRKIWPES